MEDIEDLFKNDNQDTEERIPQSKRKIVRKFGAKKEKEEDSQVEGVVIDASKFKSKTEE